METPTIERVEIDPNELLVDVNIRKDARLDKDFVASIKELGVLVPITAVRTADGQIRVRFGHRRTLGAIEAELPTVPVDVIGNEGEDDAAQIERIMTQHAENVHRAGLTSAEKVEVVAQLSAFGVKASEITKKTRIPKADVKAATAVAKSDLAKEAAERYDFLTLDQSAAIAEFEDDPDAVKALVLAAKKGGFEHILQQCREDRQEKVEIAKAEAELRKRGITVIEAPEYGDRTVMRLTKLRYKHPALTDQAHESCPGHAAYVEAYCDYEYEDDDDEVGTAKWITEVEYVCTDAVAYGHLKPSGSAADERIEGDTSAQDEIDERRREERRRVIANNKAWRAAEAVRREWLKTFLSAKTAPKDALGFIFAQVARGGFALRHAMSERHALACELLDVKQPWPEYVRRTSKEDTLIEVLARASDSRAQVIALGLVLGAHEAQLNVDTWRRPDFIPAEYLSQLTEWGYELSEIEQSVVDAAAQRQQELDADEDEEFDVPRCRICGCTDEEACEGGCVWVPDPEAIGDLCSECLKKVGVAS